MYADILRAAPAQPFRWHTSRHNQLHAIIHALSELCTTDPLTVSENIREICKQAWLALESLQITPDGWNQKEVKSTENLNKKLQHLKERARLVWSSNNPMVPNEQYNSTAPMAGFPMDDFDYLNQWPDIDFGIEPTFLSGDVNFTGESAEFQFQL